MHLFPFRVTRFLLTHERATAPPCSHHAELGVASPKKVIFEDAIESPEAVLPVYFLALFISSSII
jgi:hypothetical protein